MKSRERKIRLAAEELLHSADFFPKLRRQLEDLGIIGELRNAFTLFLAAITRHFEHPVSVLIKGVSSTGKSFLLRSVLLLIPPEDVISRTSMSGKAPVYGQDNLQGKIISLAEFRGGAVAQFLTRLQQSEGTLAHEVAVQSGRRKTTKVYGREGKPVLFSTTTMARVFEDDETRYLSLKMDESKDQTEEVIRAELSGNRIKPNLSNVEVWREAGRLLGKQKVEFGYPAWFDDLASNIPCDDPRARRDVPRFISLLQAVALCNHFSDDRRGKSLIDIKFTDYCVAYSILYRAFAATYTGVHLQVQRIAEAVSECHRDYDEPISTKKLAAYLNWEEAVTYKWAKAAIARNAIRYEP